MNRWPIRFSAIVVLFGIAFLGAYAVRTRRPPLVTYYTPSIRGLRVKALVPEGWISDEGTEFKSALMSMGINSRYQDDIEIVLRPRIRSSFLTKWFGWILAEPEEYASLSVSFRPLVSRISDAPSVSAADFDGRVVVTQDSDSGTAGVCRRILSGDRNWSAEIAYVRSDSAEFSQTQKLIAESLRFVPGK